VDILSQSKGGFEVRVSRHELELLNNALNEICNGIDVPEFATRVGATRAEVAALLNQIHRVLVRSS